MARSNVNSSASYTTMSTSLSSSPCDSGDDYDVTPPPHSHTEIRSTKSVQSLGEKDDQAALLRSKEARDFFVIG